MAVAYMKMKMKAYVLFKCISFPEHNMCMTLEAQKYLILSVIKMCVFVVMHMDKEVNQLYN